MSRIRLAFLMFLISASAMAQGTGLAAPASPATTAVASEDLQSLVVLCATRHESDELHIKWAAYLRRHYEPGMDTDALIKEITRQATGYWQIENIKSNMLGSGSRAGTTKTQSEIRAKQNLQDFVYAIPAIEKGLRNTAKAAIAKLKR